MGLQGEVMAKLRWRGGHVLYQGPKKVKGVPGKENFVCKTF